MAIDHVVVADWFLSTLSSLEFFLLETYRGDVEALEGSLIKIACAPACTRGIEPQS